MDPRSYPLERSASLLSRGAPRVAVDRDWRNGGQASRKPRHPSLSCTPAGHSAALGPSDRTMKLRSLTLGLASKSVAGWVLPDPRCVDLTAEWEHGVPRVSFGGCPGSVTGRVEG